jgi:subtilisin family serine protease
MKPSKVSPAFNLRCAAVAACMLALTGAAHAAQPSSGEWALGRLLVHARAGSTNADVDKIVKIHGGKSRRMGKSDLHIVDLPANASETAVLALLKGHPQLKFAELDRRLAPSLTSNDPYLGSQWHLPVISAPLAWDTSLGNGVIIAILDSGVLATHPDLAPQMVAGWNFFDNNSNTADVTGHGTSVAGSAAAITNNGAGVAGVAGSTRIMPLRVSDATGYAYYSTIAQAVTYAADNGARVANASFSGVFGSSTVQSAAQYLKSKGGLLVVSAGNSGIDEGAPVSTTMIPVSATDAADAKASWSSYGNYVAVAAPGVGIWTTASDGSYRAASGTSFSAPITAGIIALMMATKPTLSAAQVESLLYSTAVDLGTAGRDIYFGYGRVNAAAAVAAAATATAVDSLPPSVALTSPAASSSVSGLANVDVAASDNVGVTRVELRVNGSTVATDTGAPFQFVWDTTKLPNGAASLSAVASDAAGNVKTSALVSVTVANAVLADTLAPTVVIKSPLDGSQVRNNVTISTSASDNSDAAGIRQTLFINGNQVATATGTSLSYKWSTLKLALGVYTLTVEAQDAAGNKSTRSVQVRK